MPGVIFLFNFQGNCSYFTEHKKVHKYLRKIKPVLLLYLYFESHHNNASKRQNDKGPQFFSICPTSMPVGGSKAHILFIKETLMNNIH